MSIVTDIKRYLLEADRRRPDLRIINTSESVTALLRLTLALAGPEYSHVGKTTTMDGASVAPLGFEPFSIELPRPDGQRQTIRITGISQDAAWHLPSQRQIKVIAFSAANDPGPWDHGPAQLTPYEIDPFNYRWHNPPVAQWGHLAESLPPEPFPAPTPAPSPAQQPYPSEPGYWNNFTAEVKKRYPGGQLNDEAFRWFTRTAYDIGAGMDRDESAAKHLKELDDQIGR